MSLGLDQVIAYAPLVYQFPYQDAAYQPTNVTDPTSSQAYLPGDVTAFLGQVWVGDRTSQAQGPATGYTVGGGPTATTSSNFLFIPDDPGAVAPVRQGTPNALQSPSYVHLLPTPGDSTLVDIQYWLFYPVRGRSTFWAQLGVTSITLDILPPRSDGAIVCGYQGGGEHQGDWKHVTARVDKATGQLRAVFYSQHGSGVWVTATNGFTWNGTSILRSGQSTFQNGDRILAYAARNTHSCFPAPGQYPQQNFDYLTEIPLVGTLGIALLEWAGPGQTWDTSNVAVIANDTDLDIPATAPSWFAYPGKWGPDLNQQVSAATWDPLYDSPVWNGPVAIHAVETGIAMAITAVAINDENADTPSVQNSWHGDTGGPMTTTIQSAYWGASGGVGSASDYQKVLDVTPLAQIYYAMGLRSFTPNSDTWSPGGDPANGGLDPDYGKTKVLTMTWTAGSPVQTFGAVAFEGYDTVITLP